MWLLEDGAAQLWLTFVGTVCAVFAVAQAVWLFWWTRTRTVTKEHGLSESSA